MLSPEWMIGEGSHSLPSPIWLDRRDVRVGRERVHDRDASASCRARADRHDLGDDDPVTGAGRRTRTDLFRRAVSRVRGRADRGVGAELAASGLSTAEGDGLVGEEIRRLQVRRRDVAVIIVSITDDELGRKYRPSRARLP
jgi:hypothetical protein